VGLVRGLNHFYVANGDVPIAAHGCALVDGGGSELFARALAFQALGYRVATLRDSDVDPTPDLEAKFTAAGGPVFRWRAGRALEDELFQSVEPEIVAKLVDVAVSVKEESLVNDHIKSASKNAKDLRAIRAECAGNLSAESRALLGKAARFRGASGWFKSVSTMEMVARDVVGPVLEKADPEFRRAIEVIFDWIADGARGN
jgi:putative ATP-dependent endonuclease of the OLD family